MDPLPPPPDGIRRVLGLDPGTRLMGWAVVEAQGATFRALGHGVFRAPARLPLPERLPLLAAGLREVLAAARPTEAALEEAFHGRDARAALRLGEGRGATLLVLAEAGLPIFGYANNVVKRSVTGAGRASKERVLAMVTRILGLKTEPETLDVSDALALAVCHLQRGGAPQGGAPGIPPRLAEAMRKARRSGTPRSPRNA